MVSRKKFNAPRHICIHGHFYQPPRENAWLDTILVQKSAYPDHNWNERILTECYQPNTRARLLDAEGKICDIRNNFTDISFNIGPTLLAWLEKYAKETYEAIIEADQAGAVKYQFAGPAIAQVYNHSIMPLAQRKDKIIQIKWGIADFTYRFGRQPEGMWLAETAVDTETLEILAEEGIRYTILAPWQAARWRLISSAGDWQAGIDPRYPYRCQLPDGKTMTLFFYDGKLAGDIAFGGLLKDGKAMSNAFYHAFAEEDTEAQLVHVATDGETFGHHHRFGEMALAYCLHDIEKRKDVSILPYGAFLNRYPVYREVEIVPNSSWSCMHGVERWRSDCGCKTGGEVHWNQAWRAPLRHALDNLKTQLDTFYDHSFNHLLPDQNSEEVLQQYGTLLPHRTESSMVAFAAQLGLTDSPRQIHLFRLLEMQRNGQLMYTSCAWFFNELSGIETTQVLQYACRAMQLMALSGGPDEEPAFLKNLASARSNHPEKGNGSDIYRKEVWSEKMNLERVGMHIAARHIMLGKIPENIWNYRSEILHWQKINAANVKLQYGLISVRSATTLNEEYVFTVVLQMPGLELMGTALHWDNLQFNMPDLQKITECFSNRQWSSCRQAIMEIQGGHLFSFNTLLHDEQAWIAGEMLIDCRDVPLDNPEGVSYQDLVYLRESAIPIPTADRKKIQYYLTDKILHLLHQPYHHQNNLLLCQWLKDSEEWAFDMHDKELEMAFVRYLEGMTRLSFAVTSEHLDGLLKVLEAGRNVGFPMAGGNLVYLWRKWITNGWLPYPDLPQWQKLLEQLNVASHFNWERK
jgi:alpha-amylase/alpha-mannosidase (GH57 family)